MDGLTEEEAARLMREVAWPPQAAADVDAVTFGRPPKPVRKRTFRDDLRTFTIGAHKPPRCQLQLCSC